VADDLAGLARLATRRPAVRDALVREWPASASSSSDGGPAALLGYLLLEDPDWFLTIGAGTFPVVLRSGLRWAAERLEATLVERLALTVAGSDLAGQGWALRDVVFGSGLPAEEIARMVSRNFAVLAGDDGWPQEVARQVPGAFDTSEPADESRRKTGMWARRRR
jgi:hypothetical protein